MLFLAGMFAASNLSDRLSLDFSLPGQPGDTAEQQMMDEFGTSTWDTFVAVVTVPEGETVEENADAIADVFDQAVATTDPVRMVDYASTGDEGFITDDGRSTFALIQGPMPQSFGPGIEEQIEPALDKAAKAAGLRERLHVVRAAVRGR